MAPMNSKFDVLRATATELASRLTEGSITSVDLIDGYLSQIEAHNHAGLSLRALIAVAPRDLLLHTARKLDEEREAGKARGPLHGIPIILKVPFIAQRNHALLSPSSTGYILDRASVGNANDMRSFCVARSKAQTKRGDCRPGRLRTLRSRAS